MKKGFTIIEVMIVLAIMGIVVAIGAGFVARDRSQQGQPVAPRTASISVDAPSRWYDAEFGVACYRYNGNAVSCVKVR